MLYEGIVMAMQKRGVNNERDAVRAMKNSEIAREAIQHLLDTGRVDAMLADELFEAYCNTFVVHR